MRFVTATRCLWLVSVLLVGFSQTEAATPTWRDCDDCPAMVEIPSGSVTVGSGPDAFDRRATERPRVEAEIARPFAIAESEITRAQYAAFVRATGYEPPSVDRAGKQLPQGCNFWNGAFGFVADHSWRNPGFEQSDYEPVLCVSFEDAEAYAAWLSKKTGRTYRIPSSVEFEYAARAGSDAAWSWGNASEEACKHANIGDRTLKRRWPERQEFNCDDGFAHTAPVKRFGPNKFGLYDMLGNAWEWTADCWLENLTNTRVDGRALNRDDSADCAFRTPMGGSWISGPGWARAASRSKDPSGYRSFMLGFRVAADMP
jgi:formylglycine-generating enzyme required for sulfatase activity